MRNAVQSMVGPAVVVAVVIGIVVTGQQPESLSITSVKDGLYYINGVGGNVGVRVTSEGVILVDDKFPRNFSGIEAQLREVTRKPVKYVINTHHHGDHSGGNAEYIKSAEIIAHENARRNMVRADQPAPPRIVFADQTSVHLGGVEVKAHYLGSGHTNGDSVIYFPDLRTIHAGDLLHGIAPFIDYANGGNSAGWVETLNNILALDFDTAIPGHGALMTRADVEAFRDEFVSVRGRMTELIRSGVSKGEAPDRIKTDEISWTMRPDGLFMRRSLPGFYEEMASNR